MSKTLSYMAAVIAAALFAGATGCTTMHVTMNPEAPLAELANRHIQHKIGLFMDSEFLNYHWEDFSGAELSTLDYDLGSASKSLFLQAFTLASNGALLIESKPPYPDPARNDIFMVVHPEIRSFSEKHSLWMRDADYYAEISYHVTVYDKAGRTVLENNYSAEGVAMGGAMVNRNYAAPAEKAMERAVVMIIEDISKLKEQAEIPPPKPAGP